MGVPTTLETGLPDAVMNFYDTGNRFQFGTTSNNLQAFRNAVELGDGDCRAIEQPQNVNSTNYLSCAHVIPEVWTARSAQVREYIRDGILDPPIALGALGIEGWFIPKFTAEQVPSLTSWLGLAGEQNRQKLAQTFKRPTTWLDYCSMISPDNCTTPDAFAQRPPEYEWEEESLFVDGQYTGYFLATERNDCSTSNNTQNNCTGHIGDYPCGWGGSLQATAHWLNIALESNGKQPHSGGYTYGQLGQMWRAANATREHVAMMWVVPDPVYEEFLGTDFEFVKVTLPAPSQTCLEHKINPEHRCVEDPALRLGTSVLGVCDETARPLYKLILSRLHEVTQGESIPDAIKNPASTVLSQFSLTELQINELFRYWLSNPDEPREAICEWVVDNLDDLQQYIPQSYPRTLQQNASQTSLVLSLVCTVLGGLATLLVVITGYLVYRHRNKRALRYAQVEFLYLLLLGSAMVSIGAILTGLQSPSNASCITQIWLVSFGYTLVLVPLLVKVAAINRLMQAARRMRRVKLHRGSLHGGVMVISLLVTIYLIVWTVVDPPRKEAHYELTDRQVTSVADLGESSENETMSGLLFESTVVQARYFCTSDSETWQYVAIGWNVVLILCATALAFQSRTVKQAFNEAQVLSKLIYGHFMFILLRVMAFLFRPSVSVHMLSIIFSLDTIFMLGIYFIPKLIADDQCGINVGNGSTHISGIRSSRFDSTAHLTQLRSGVGDISSQAFVPSIESSLEQSRLPGLKPNSNAAFASDSEKQNSTNCVDDNSNNFVVATANDEELERRNAKDDDAPSETVDKFSERSSSGPSSTGESSGKSAGEERMHDTLGVPVRRSRLKVDP